jgi:hypothetical protein
MRLCTMGTELCDSADPQLSANDVKVKDVPDHLDVKVLHSISQPQCCVFQIPAWHLVPLSEL